MQKFLDLEKDEKVPSFIDIGPSKSRKEASKDLDCEMKNDDCKGEKQTKSTIENPEQEAKRLDQIPQKLHQILVQEQEQQKHEPLRDVDQVLLKLPQNLEFNETNLAEITQ